MQADGKKHHFGENERLFRKLLQQQQQQIADKGFTQVVNHNPERTNQPTLIDTAKSV